MEWKPTKNGVSYIECGWVGSSAHVLYAMIDGGIVEMWLLPLQSHFVKYAYSSAVFVKWIYIYVQLNDCIILNDIQQMTLSYYPVIFEWYIEDAIYFSFGI